MTRKTTTNAASVTTAGSFSAAIAARFPITSAVSNRLFRPSRKDRGTVQGVRYEIITQMIFNKTFVLKTKLPYKVEKILTWNWERDQKNENLNFSRTGSPLKSPTKTEKLPVKNSDNEEEKEEEVRNLNNKSKSSSYSPP